MSFVKVDRLFCKFNITNEYEKTEYIDALNDISLEIDKGAFVAVVGRNGSGKSTFAKHLNALIKPTKGTVMIKCYDTADDRNKWVIRQHAGMVFQNPDNQIVSSIIEEDVAFGPENLCVETDELVKRVENSLNTVGMTAYRYKSPDHLSGGQKQRVAIAGVLAMECDCIILDEPTSMLDPKGRKDVINAIKRLNEEKKITVILITHHMEEVVDADMIFVLDKGKLVKSGSPKEVFFDVETLEAAGLKVPEITEVGYELYKKGFEISHPVFSVSDLSEQIIRIWKKI